ncbi:NAD-glutamate dehydrogenase domain-containing protein, partial [Mycobacterium montefiorense]|uniref:NAD-glutamate dehydrogenase domain-containing protein n=1 Tax=Mycobacterium montefiorense TaxID=154654 RepID=UPI00222E5AB9
DDDKLLVLAQATVGSYLRYGAYPYAIGVREYLDGGVIEHRFVGLFTVSAMNADVLEIPSISRRVREALAMADNDPAHPAQLILDVIQTVPRSELFTLSGERL